MDLPEIFIQDFTGSVCNPYRRRLPLCIKKSINDAHVIDFRLAGDAKGSGAFVYSSIAIGVPYLLLIKVGSYTVYIFNIYSRKPLVKWIKDNLRNKYIFLVFNIA